MSSVPRHALTGVPTVIAPRFRLLPLVVCWVLAVVAFTVVLTSGRLTTTSELLLGHTGMALALGINAGACLLAARRKTAASRSWTWLGIALGFRALASLVAIYEVLNQTSSDKNTVWDAIGYFGYSVPVLLAVLLFPRPPERKLSRFRTVLDAAVITLGVVLVSEATVLYRVRAGVDVNTLSSLGSLMFPAIDLATCAVVLTLGMRQPPANRLVWLCLGAGLVTSAVTDTVYGVWMANGIKNLGGTPVVVGWIAASALVGLATQVPNRLGRNGWDLALAQRLVPYVPVLAAIIVIGAQRGPWASVVLIESILLLLAVAARQVWIVYENLTLTRDLESKVAARTSELATMASIVTSSRDAIVGVSTENIVTVWNPAAERLYGYRGADVIGRSPTFLPPRGAADLRDLLDSAARGEQLSAYEIDWRRPDQTTVPVAMTVSPVHDKTTVQGISIIGQDITERRLVAESLERAREEALESSRLKSEFLATMSHEIRTPMNGVIGLTSLLIDTDLDSLQRKYAEGVRSAGQSLIDVINDILDFSKLEAGRVIIEEKDFDLRGLVDEVGNLMAPAAFAKGLELSVCCPPTTPVAVRGDRVRVRQILLNLVSNGVKFTATGEVAVRVRAVPVEDGRINLRVEVTDTGIGVAAADQSRLFDSFTQADASTTRRFGGTGLGLAISRHLVEVMGGTIGLRSDLGAGSTFWFEIPLAVGGPATEPPAGPRHDLLAGLRVLVVNDNATARGILHDQLTSWRMQVDLVDTGPAALDRLRAAGAEGAPYDLALLDLTVPGVNTPDGDGLQLARAISAEPTLVGLSILILTSAHRLPSAAMVAAGIGEWLTKPVSSLELYDRLTRLLASRDVVKPPRSAPVPKNPPAALGGRILVVEDNALNQLVAAGLVARLGYEVDSVDDGVQALAALEVGSYAAVLMDCHMPGMDGFAATREIRRRQAGQDRTPVIALTAGALAEDRERCMAAGMDDFIAKPVDFDALETVLGRWVGVRQPTEVDADLLTQPAADQSAIDWSRVKVLEGLAAPDGSSLMGTFIATFVSRGANRVGALRRAARAGAAHDLTLAAHELKGSASTIGAVRVAAICGVLERAGRAGDAVAPELLDELDLAFERATAALDSLASTPVP